MEVARTVYLRVRPRLAAAEAMLAQTVHRFTLRHAPLYHEEKNKAPRVTCASRHGRLMNRSLRLLPEAPPSRKLCVEGVCACVEGSASLNL